MGCLPAPPTFLSVNADRTCVYMSDWSMTACVRTGRFWAPPPRLGPDSTACRPNRDSFSPSGSPVVQRAGDSRAHRRVALLRLQVLLVHLVELVEDSRHHWQAALLLPVQNWNRNSREFPAWQVETLTTGTRTLRAHGQDHHLAVPPPQQEVHQLALVLQQVDSRRQPHLQVPQVTWGTGERLQNNPATVISGRRRTNLHWR